MGRGLFRLVPLILMAGCTAGGGVHNSGPGTGPDWLAAAMRPHRTVPSVPLSGDLGSETNPVRVLMPIGEREYLHRLRCTDGTPPTFERAGSTGIGPYGKILDLYSVECAGDDRKASVYMDMYHCVEESRPIPGFEIVPEVGTRDRSQCD